MDSPTNDQIFLKLLAELITSKLEKCYENTRKFANTFWNALRGEKQNIVYTRPKKTPILTGKSFELLLETDLDAPSAMEPD